MKVSVVVPGYNAEKTLSSLLDSLSNQSLKDFEIIFVDDCSQDSTAQIAKSYQCNLIQLAENHGPAYCRNIGAKKARGEILVFTDSDCTVEDDWLERILGHFLKNDTEAIMGKLVLLPSNFLGNSISALGFPAGGSIGFDKIWKVDQKGFTDSLSSCNCAIKKGIFREIGGFDETFPYAGGEDSLLAYNIRRLNYTIKYCPDVLVYHGSRDSFRDFLRWQFRRGVSSFIFSTKVTNKKDFISLRLWSTRNILRTYCRDRKFPLICFMLLNSVCIQFIGYLSAKHNRGSYASSNN
jgi:glycosyltransferase involved in cell wall biosynthesis